MLKKLWQRFVKKAEAEEDEKQEDGREDGQSNRQDKQEKETNYVSVTSVPAAIRDIYFGLFSLQAVVIGIYKVIEAVAADPRGLTKASGGIQDWLCGTWPGPKVAQCCWPLRCSRLQRWR